MGLIMQALTARDFEEKAKILVMLQNTDNGENYMHEAFDPNNPADYTRPWFAWTNSLFAIFISSILPDLNMIENLK